MSLVYLLVGLVLLALVVVDLLWTTLWVEGGAGPLTTRFTSWTWRAIRRLDDRRRVLTLAGPLVLTLGLTAWVSLVWLGWTLVFAASEPAIVDTVDGGPISWADRLYFTGYAMFTLGNGDFAPREGIWQIVTVLATGSGMLLITLSVTYVISVLEAVTQKRSFASGVSGLGSHGTAIVRTSWEDDEFRGLELPLDRFVAELNALTTNHKAYPVLHYFHSEQDEQAPPVSVAALDEALSIFKFGVSERARPSQAVVANARSSVTDYLDTIGDAFMDPADQPPPPPDLETLREEGVPTVDDEAFGEAIAELSERRRALFGAVESDARQWPADENE